MRMVLIAAILLPVAAWAQTVGPADQPSPGPTAPPDTSTPAPVPSVPPETSQTTGTRAPAEQIAPSDRVDTRGEAGPANATPLSGGPPSDADRSTPALTR